MSSIPELRRVTPPTCAPFIALVDANNFFVSCERLFRPDLATTPIIVLSSNDGCVISRSNEAKALGFQMGAPFFQVRDLCEIHSVTVFSSNFSLYQDISARLLHTLRRFADILEGYSIDEAFLLVRAGDLGDASLYMSPDEVHDDAHEREYMHALSIYAHRVRACVGREVGIPVSVGIAPTKTLAKVATHRAKGNPASHGVCVLRTNDEMVLALKETPIAEVWGIGRRCTPVLLARGVHTAWEFVAQTDAWIRGHVGIEGVRTAYELKGQSCFPVGEKKVLRKSLFHSQSFSISTTHLHVLKGAVSYHARTVAELLRGEHAVARTIAVHLYPVHKVPAQNTTSATITLPVPTNDTLLLVRMAHTLLRQLYRSGVWYKKAGVSVCDIVHEESVPTRTLFGEQENTHATLMCTLDALRHRFGDSLRIADEGGFAWRARHARQSPSHTTQWHAIRKVRIPSSV